MSKPKIHLFAEALTHIRQLNLHATLQTDKNEHTRILLSSDKKLVTALHDGESSSIYLPTQISGTAKVTFPLERKTEFSARLQIEDVDQLKSSAVDAGGVEVPWSASDLTELVSIRCKCCAFEILPPQRVRVWKDLPSDQWADLMDLWFCHRPHDHDASQAQAADSQKLSTSKVTADRGIGLVDTLSFLLHADDCSTLTEAKHSSEGDLLVLQCPQCEATVGAKQSQERDCRLYKSRLAIVAGEGRDTEEYPAAIFMCAQLLFLIESSVSRKVVVHADTGPDADSEQQGFLLWIFNPDIYYSSSKRGPTVHRAAKVFYKSLTDPEQFLDTNSNTHEEFIVPTIDFVEFTKTLKESTDVLPQTARKFQDWDIGLLDRWEKVKSGSATMDQNPLNKKVEDGFQLFKLPAGMQELYL